MSIAKISQSLCQGHCFFVSIRRNRQLLLMLVVDNQERITPCFLQYSIKRSKCFGFNCLFCCALHKGVAQLLYHYIVFIHLQCSSIIVLQLTNDYLIVLESQSKALNFFLPLNQPNCLRVSCACVDYSELTYLEPIYLILDFEEDQFR